MSGRIRAMPFTEAQKTQFIRLLEAKGWQMRDGTICSAGGGLWFSDSHFGNWSPSQMHEIFTRRAERIVNAQLGDWQRASRENPEASLAAEAVIGT
jgi:hypothetical protein